MWCIETVLSSSMTGRSKSTQRQKAKRSAAPRASVTFPPDVYRTLEEIAKQKKVSVAWVVRDAAEEYVKAQWPLLAAPGEKP